MNNSIILKVENLSIGIQNQHIISLIEDINFTLYEGEIFGLIGESGCGKTITSLGITGTLPEPNGIFLNGSIEIFLENKSINVLSLNKEELRKIRGSEIGVIFQEPFMALNPLYTIEFHFKELYRFHKDTIKKKNIQFEERLYSLLKRAGFSEPDKILKSYPHQLSGGMLQRIVIILAILLKPKFIIADEPTTALDVTIQAQIMELLNELKEEENTSILLITHNMGLLAQYADRLAVMYAGRIVEQSNIDSFLTNPLHPYSEGLLKAIPELEKDKKIEGIPGNVPSPENYPNGCRFINRCPYRFDLCEKKPEAINLNNHIVYCWKYNTNS
ncbi:MAG: peptide ABC transporter ATPase [Leptospiraceae bacterium]|nr:MAG: peptide ABC transporter ATPase [Leptospiraceae bacterium]